jgi:hypothetical protein
MRWRSHALVTGCFLSMAGCGLGELAVAMICSAAPDWVEAPLGRVRLLGHRGISHELLVWLVPFVALRLLLPSAGLFREFPIPPGIWLDLPRPLFQVLPAGILGLGALRIDFPFWTVPLGGVLHLLLGDVLTPGGIRLFGFSGVSFSVFRTGSLGEHLYVFGFLVCTVCFHVFRHTDIRISAWVEVRLAQAVLAVLCAALGWRRWRTKRRRQAAPCTTVSLESLSKTWLEPGDSVAAEASGAVLSVRSPAPEPRSPDGVTPEATQIPGDEKRKPRPGPSDERKRAPSPVSAGADPVADLTSRKAWKSNELWTFLVEEIHPEMEVLAEDPVLLDAIVHLLRLLDAHPMAPSVYGYTDDGARITNPETFSRLGKVSLTRHLFNTVRAGKRLLLTRFGKTYRASYGKFLLTFLGHDIGKLPFFHQGRLYTKDEHCRAGAGYVLDLLDDHRFAEEIARAIRKHHERSFPDKLDALTVLLIEADTEARNLELGEGDKAAIEPAPAAEACATKKPETPAPPAASCKREYYGPERREIPEGFPTALVFEGLRGKANATHRLKPRLFVSVSQPDGWVYYHPEVIYEAIQDAAREARIQDIWFFDESFKKSVLFSFHKHWEQDGLARQVGPSFYGSYYRVTNISTNRVSRAWFMAVRCEALGATSSELEEERKAREATAHVKVEPWKEEP